MHRSAYILIFVLLIAAIGGYLWYAQEPAPPEIPDESERVVRLFYYDPARDTDADGNIRCSRQGLVAVERTVPSSTTPLEDTIRLLLRGDLSASERAAGASTEFPLEGFALESAQLEDTELILRFADPMAKTTGGACRVGILWYQIEATALQFDEVDSVRFLPEELFQP